MIAIAVRWKLPYGLSDRDVEELLAMRGINADHLMGSANATEPRIRSMKQSTQMEMFGARQRGR